MSGDERPRRARALFEAAVAAPAAQRAALLAAEPDAAVRRDVEELLRFAQAGEHPLDGWRIDSGELRSALQSGLGPWPDPAPESIGPYRIAGVLGAGSMSTVFLGERVHPPGTVAVKLLRPWLVQGEALRRFELEVEILSRLDHPRIARILDAGRAEVGGREHPFIVLEHIRGAPLHVWAREHGADRRSCLALFLALCDAVAHAHARGVVHRDLKPTNVLVDERGEPHVLDFGVSSISEETMRATRMLTAMGQLIGTLEYMSPEQAAGRPGDVDTRSDVYALGVILYELLAGRRPFDFEGLSLPECLRRIAEGEAAPLRTARDGERRVPADLETIVDKALAKDRARRYATVRELARDVERFLADEPISARPPSSFYLARKYARRHPVLSTAFAAGLLAAAATGAGVLLGWREARVQAALARGQEQLARTHLAEAEAALAEAESLTAVLTKVIRAPDVPRRDGREVLLSETVSALGADIEEQFRDQPRARGRLRFYLADSLESLGRFEEAQAEAEGARADLQAAGLADTDLYYNVEELRGRLLRHRGRPKEARDLYRGMHAELAAARGATDPLAIVALEELGIALAECGEYAESEQVLRAAVELRERTAGPEALPTLMSRVYLQRPLAMQGAYAEVVATLEALLPALREAYAGEPHRLLEPINLLAQSLDASGQPGRSLALHREEVQLAENAFGADAAPTWVARLALLKALQGLGELEQGLALAREVRAWALAELDPGHANAIMAAQVLGVFLAGTGEQAEALDMFRQALAAVEASGLGERSARTEVDLRLRIGDLCTWLEQPDEAVAALEPALAAVEANPQWAGQFAVPVQMALAHAYVVAGRRAEGLDLYRRAIALALQEQGIDGVARMLLNPVGSYALDLDLWSEVEALLEPLAAPLHAATLEGTDDLRCYAFSLWVLLGLAQAHNEHLDGAERSLAEAEALIGRMAADRLPQRIRASYRDFAGMLGREARSLEAGAAPAAR